MYIPVLGRIEKLPVKKSTVTMLAVFRFSKAHGGIGRVPILNG